MDEDKNKLKKILREPTLGVTDVSRNRTMWQEIADEMNGEFHIKHTKSHEIEMQNISIPYKSWSVEISVSDTKPLKFNMIFTSHQVFEFNLSWEDLIEKIRKKFGARDIETGSKEFDVRYLITSDKPWIVKELLTGEIRDSMLKHNVYTLSYHSEKNTTVSELTGIIQKTPGDKAMILEMIRLFQRLADHLQKMKIVR
jgi:hypothetical protein